MSPAIPLRSCATAWTLSAFADEAGDAVDDQIAALRRAKLAHVDLRGVDGVNIASLPLDHAEKVRGKLDAAGVRVNMLGSPLGKIDLADDFKTDLAKLRHLGRLAEVLGCKAVRIFSYYNKAGAPPDAWRAGSLDRLRRLRDLAGELGLVLYHENERHIFGDGLANVLAIAEALRDGETFRMIFDFDNFNQGGDDVWENWLALRDATDAFHLKDSDERHQHVPIGEGRGRARDILADALARGWKGPLSLEPHLRHSPAVAATGPHGQANRKLSELSQADVFQVAAEAAQRLLGEIGASVM